MSQYVLRLQALDGYSALFSNVFSDRFERVLYVHHTGKKGDNPHYHFCLTCDYKKDALRKYLKSKFTLASGNKHISLKDWDGDIKACSYLYHEGTPVTNHRGFTQSELDLFCTLNKEVKSRQVKIPDILDVVIKQMIKTDPFGNIIPSSYVRPQSNPYDLYSENYIPEKKRAFRLLLLELRKRGEWIPNKFQMERYLHMILSKVNSSDQNYESFIDDLYSEYFPNRS